jgi:hypothetical protein
MSDVAFRGRRIHPGPDELPPVFGGLAELVEAARANGLGRSHVDELAATGETLSTGHTARQWGVITHQANGQIISEPLAWPDCSTPPTW